MSRTHRSAAVTALLTALTGMPAGAATRPETPPNVLYLCIEDTGPFLGCYGYEPVRTPHIDAFAREGVLFEDVHCQVALCTPSRTSILTGIRPSTSGIVQIDDDWREKLPGVTSLPRLFREHGYHTEVVGKIHDSRCGGMDDAYDIDRSGRLTTNEQPLASLRAARSHGKPFFLAIGYAQAHTPWEPSAWALAQYDLSAIDVEGMGREFRGEVLDDGALRRHIRDYYASITDVDRLVGEVLAEARNLGMFEDTVILVGSMDHGFNLGWHGKYGKGNNHDPETRVPLIVRIPANPANGSRAAGIVELVDLYPTLVALCGLPPPPQHLEGSSLVPLLAAPGRPWKKAAFTHRAYHLDDIGVKTADYTLIRRLGEPVQLFDRRLDPLNLRNVAEQNPGVVDSMLALLEAGWTAARP